MPFKIQLSGASVGIEDHTRMKLSAAGSELISRHHFPRIPDERSFSVMAEFCINHLPAVYLFSHFMTSVLSET